MTLVTLLLLYWFLTYLNIDINLNLYNQWLSPQILHLIISKPIIHAIYHMFVNAPCQKSNFSYYTCNMVDVVVSFTSSKSSLDWVIKIAIKSACVVLECVTTFFPKLFQNLMDELVASSFSRSTKPIL